MSGPVTFLVASPHLHGGVFGGSVILLLEHDTGGAMGLIVNAPLPAELSQVIDALTDAGRSRRFGGFARPRSRADR